MSFFNHLINELFQRSNGLIQIGMWQLGSRDIDMTAAAHTLHHDLHIDFVDGTGADIDALIDAR